MTEHDIRLLRRRLGLTQKELAEALGVDQVTVSRWERGVDAPRPGRLARLRDMLRKDEYGRATARQAAIVRLNLAPATIVSCDHRLTDISSKGIVHFARTRGIDVTNDIGRCLGYHGETVRNQEFSELFLKRTIDPDEIVMGRILVNVRGVGSVIHLEPIVSGDTTTGFVFYQVATCPARPSDRFEVERAEVVPLEVSSGFTAVFVRDGAPDVFP